MPSFPCFSVRPVPVRRRCLAQRAIWVSLWHGTCTVSMRGFRSQRPMAVLPRAVPSVLRCLVVSWWRECDTIVPPGCSCRPAGASISPISPAAAAGIVERFAHRVTLSGVLQLIVLLTLATGLCAGCACACVGWLLACVGAGRWPVWIRDRLHAVQLHVL